MSLRPRLIIALAAICLAPGLAGASELTYQPVNPNFGGNPFNYQPLLNSAIEQNHFQEPTTATTRDPLADFERSLQSRLLSRLSSDIADAIFGEDAADQGSFTVGDTIIDFINDGSIVTVVLTDGATGGSTTIQLPVPSF